jgi:hypothetical protein
VRRIVDYIQSKTGFFIDKKVLISAEDDDKSTASLKKKKDFRDAFEGFIVDMRSYKLKNVNCPNRDCIYAKKKRSFKYPVQREVDTAIAMTAVRARAENRVTMKNLIILAGDGDFTDLVRVMSETFKINVFIFAWSESLDY